jgi:hypothetical protein
MDNIKQHPYLYMGGAGGAILLIVLIYYYNGTATTGTATATDNTSAASQLAAANAAASAEDYQYGAELSASENTNSSNDYIADSNNKVSTAYNAGVALNTDNGIAASVTENAANNTTTQNANSLTSTDTLASIAAIESETNTASNNALTEFNDELLAQNASQAASNQALLDVVNSEDSVLNTESNNSLAATAMAEGGPYAEVTSDYSSILGRAPDVAGLNYWVGEITSGAMTANQVTNSFETSAEHLAQIRNQQSAPTSTANAGLGSK